MGQSVPNFDEGSVRKKGFVCRVYFYSRTVKRPETIVSAGSSQEGRISLARAEINGTEEATHARSMRGVAV